MGIFTSCHHCGSDWCNGDCIIDKHRDLLRKMKKRLEEMRPDYWIPPDDLITAINKLLGEKL